MAGAEVRDKHNFGPLQFSPHEFSFLSYMSISFPSATKDIANILRNDDKMQTFHSVEFLSSWPVGCTVMWRYAIMQQTMRV